MIADDWNFFFFASVQLIVEGFPINSSSSTAVRSIDMQSDRM